MNIRLESPADRCAIHAVHAACFPTPYEADLVDALRHAGRLSISLVAAQEAEVVGHVAFSPVTAPGGAAGMGLGPVAVLASWRRRGIAAQLIRAGLDQCAESRHGFVVVLGDPRYYQRFGFRPAGRWGWHDEFGGGDAFQALELRPGVIPAGAGAVRYAPEFTA